MKTIHELQAAREHEYRATDFEGMEAYALNESYKEIKKSGRIPYSFPISGDALQRARYYAEQQ